MRRGVSCALLCCVLAWPWAGTADQTDPERGEYVARAAGCVACHTDLENDGAYLAGGVAFETPFGTFYSPNITPDPGSGIGAWTEADLAAALTLGVGPDGRHYYPVFPYTAYAGLLPGDTEALFAYLRGVPGVAQVNRAHVLPWFMRWRFINRLWKWLFFDPAGAAERRAGRGAYLVNVLGHCGECHTPRNRLGALDPDMHLAGTRDGPDASAVPNITPHPDTGIGRWSRKSLHDFLRRGMYPDGDFAGGLMVDVVDEGLRYLSEADLEAIVDYLQSIPAIDNRIGPADGTAN